MANGKADEKKGYIGVFVLLVKLLSKLGSKLLPLIAKLGKGAKITKTGLVGASFASYAYMFTWEFALMIIIMLFVHESGHIWAMKKYGIKTKGIYFLPFVGGAAVAEGDFPSRKAEVVVAIMGPIWGFALALAAGLAYLETKNPLFAATSAWMAMINLFNLLPINPLDGGRIFKSIAFSIHSKIGFMFLALGLIVCGLIAYYSKLGLFLLLLIIGSMDLFFEYSSYGKGKIRAIKKLIGEIDKERSDIQAEVGEIDMQDYLSKCRYTEGKQRLIARWRALGAYRMILERGAEIAQRDWETAEAARRLSRKAILGSACSYLVVAAVLYGLMIFMAHVPGAKIAMDVLRG